MLLSLLRIWITPKSIVGELSVDSAIQCYTLENTKLAIPHGFYQVDLYHSPHFGFDVPRLLNVPDRTDIEIHPGNTFVDTHGCILVGQERAADFVGKSRMAFDALMIKIRKGVSTPDGVWIDVKV